MSDKISSHEHHEHADATNNVVSESTMKVQNPRLATILETDKPNPWGKGYLELYGVCLLMFLCSTMNVRRGWLVIMSSLTLI